MGAFEKLYQGLGIPFMYYQHYSGPKTIKLLGQRLTQHSPCAIKKAEQSYYFQRRNIMNVYTMLIDLGNASTITLGAPGPLMEYNLGGGRPLVHF